MTDSSDQLLTPPPQNQDEVAVEIDDEIGNIEIGPRFLDRPLDNALVSGTQSALLAWLVNHTSDLHTAAAIADRFPSYFIFSLNREWRKNAKVYGPIREALDTPFMRAGEREWEWASYSAMLGKKIQEPIFDEPFSLNQIYIPPNAFYVEKGKGLPSVEMRSTEQGPKFVVSLEEELLEWLDKKNPDDTMRVISGGPGSGKSSFLRVFAAKLAVDNKIRVLLVALHLIDPLKDLIAEIGRFVQDGGFFTNNPLDAESPESNLLLIFDGLDELASQGKVAAETSRAFIYEVERTLQKRNTTGLKLRVVISGRELSIQTNQSDFRGERQVLNLLPYYVPGVHPSSRRQYQKDGGEFIDSKGLLRIDLRDIWWANYGKLTGRAHDGLPTELKRTDLDEITSQPLLNYLVALSYTRGKIDFNADVNLNAIYADLISAVYQRGYEKNRPYEPIRPLSFEHFVRILEEIGLAAWHGDGRTTSVSEIEEHCRTSGIGPLLDVFKEGAKVGVTRLLAAFFFRQHGQRSGGDATFVFTHKSFGEYLAARRIARAVSKVVRERLERDKSPDEGWDEKEALKQWAQITGATAISTHINTFLKGELRSLHSADVHQQKLQELFGYVLQQGMPMEQLQLPTFKVTLFQARNSEESLLVALNAFAILTGVCSTFGNIDTTAFGAWLRRIQGQRNGPQNVLVFNCLSYIDLRGMNLDIIDLYNANLVGSDLTAVSAHFANLSQANLTGANFQHAMLNWSTLEGANVTGANFKYAQLDEANLNANFTKEQLKTTKGKGRRTRRPHHQLDLLPS